MAKQLQKTAGKKLGSSGKSKKMVPGAKTESRAANRKVEKRASNGRVEMRSSNAKVASRASNGRTGNRPSNGRLVKGSSNGRGGLTTTRRAKSHAVEVNASRKPVSRAKNNLQKITLNLWFDNKAEEAANFYVSVFSENDAVVSRGTSSAVGYITHYGEAGAKVSGMPEGSIMTVAFRLSGQEFVALNGGPLFKFTEALSLMITCETQEEIDYFWEKLTAGGEESVCGWLKDKYGLSWQVVPSGFDKLMQDSDAEKVERVMEAFLKMKKIDIAGLKAAEKGRSVLA